MDSHPPQNRSGIKRLPLASNLSLSLSLGLLTVGLLALSLLWWRPGPPIALSPPPVASTPTAHPPIVTWLTDPVEERVPTEWVLGATISPTEVYLGLLTTLTYTVVYSGVGSVEVSLTIPDSVQLDPASLPHLARYEAVSRRLTWPDTVAGLKRVTFHGRVSRYLLADPQTTSRQVTTPVTLQSPDEPPLTTPARFYLRHFQLE